MAKSVILLSALASLASAWHCTNLTIPISISARNGVFNLTAPASNIDVTNFILDQTRQGHNHTQELLTGYATVSGDYSIAATLCHPESGPADTVQLLTHGIGFDRSYWDFSYSNYKYSYAAQATAQGYSTFSWDRLGVGASSRGEPVNEIQSSLEISALYALTTMLKAGTLTGAEGTTFSKVVHVGHSFGSIQSYSLNVLYPDISDAVVLTGFSQNSTFVPYFALGSNLILAATVPALADYPTGYLANGDASSVQIDFFAPGNFDPEVLAIAYATGKPVTPGELLTLSGSTGAVNPMTGPALIITGERDIPFCGGDCLITGDPALPSILDASKPFFPSSSSLETFVVPAAGHGLNLEYNFQLSYDTIFTFLASNGLKP